MDYKMPRNERDSGHFADLDRYKNEHNHDEMPESIDREDNKIIFLATDRILTNLRTILKLNNQTMIY